MLQDVGVQGVALGLVAVGTKMADAQAVKYVKGADEAAVTAVHAVVVGGEEDVKAGTADCCGQFIGRAELGIAGVGGTAERGLKVADGNISGLNLWFDLGEAAVITVGAVCAAC